MAIVTISGAHRTGKTTLCEQLVKEMPNTYLVRTNVSQALKEHGFNPERVPSGVFDMLAHQKVVLDHLINEIKKYKVVSNSLFIFDRSPLDALGYFRLGLTLDMIHEIEKERTKSASYEKAYQDVQEYVRRAKESCINFVDFMVLVQPGIPIIAESGKALASYLYSDQLNTVMLGDYCDIIAQKISNGADPLNSGYLFSRKETDLGYRVDTLINMLSDIDFEKSVCMTQQTSLMN